VQICGIDDAGRGSMLGPLVIAGISLDKKNLRKFFIKKLLKLLTIIILQKFPLELLMPV
jgi:ribonuclease HIII